MTDRELKKLDKTELLTILIDLSEENDALREKNAQLQSELDSAMARASSRSRFDSLAQSFYQVQSDEEPYYIPQPSKKQDSVAVSEMSRRVNAVFESAQAAADDYLSAIRAVNERMDEDYRRIISDAMSQASLILGEAEKVRESRIADADNYCKEMSARFKSINKNLEIINNNFELINKWK